MGYGVAKDAVVGRSQCLENFRCCDEVHVGDRAVECHDLYICPILGTETSTFGAAVKVVGVVMSMSLLPFAKFEFPVPQRFGCRLERGSASVLTWLNRGSLGGRPGKTRWLHFPCGRAVRHCGRGRVRARSRGKGRSGWSNRAWCRRWQID